MTTVLRLTPTFKIGSRRSWHIVEAAVVNYKTNYWIIVSGFFEPLFYLLSLGVGLNHLVGHLHVGGRVLTYAQYVAPGMLATSAMNGAVSDAVINTFWRLKVSKQYDSVLATPLDVNDVALGAMLWACIRGAMYSVSFFLCMWALGDVVSPWSIGSLPAAFLSSFAFSAVGLAVCTWLRSWQDFDLVQLVTLPIFLFSGTFFPVSLYPTTLRYLVQLSPLYQSAALLRAFDLGQFGVSTIAHASYLLFMALVGLNLAARRFRRILTP